jgi:hypothetical protein
MRATALLLIATVGCVGKIEGLGAEATGDGPFVEPPSDPNPGCASSCHGSASNNAPPKSMSGATETTFVGVGAHQQHVLGSGWHRPVTCSDCHAVPATVDSPGHIDGDNKAELTFGMVAGASSTWNGTTCTVGCHGSVAIGAAIPTPQWTKVDGTQSVCGSCHGIAGTGMSGQHNRHIVGENMECTECHGDVIGSAKTFVNTALHINGVHDVKMTAGTYNAGTKECANTGCHGTEHW